MTYQFRCFCCLFILMTFVPGHTLAQEGSQRDLEPIEITDGSLSLLNAISLTLDQDPNIKLQRETTFYDQGKLQSESGRFDTRLILNAEGKWTQTELSPDVRKRERERREDLRDDILDRGRAYKMMVAEDSYLESQSEDINFSGSIMDFVPEEGPALTPSDERDMERTQLQLDDRNSFYKDWMELDTADADEIENSRQESIALDKDELNDETIENNKLKAESEKELLKLGGVPKTEEETSVSFDLSTKKSLRSGVVLSSGIVITENGSQYRHKEQEDSPLYTSQVKFDILVPLGKGRGKNSTGAAEKAARIDYESSLLTLQHTTSKSVYSTILAYWELVAAQNRLIFYRKSAELQKEILELSNALVDADELPRIELARIKANVADAMAVVADAERTLDQARLNLAKTIGLKVDNINHAPLASDPFPEPPELSVVNTLEPVNFLNSAMARRQDCKAAAKHVKSAGVLVRAAEVDLAPQADVGLTVSYSGLEQDANIGDGLDGVLFKDFTGPSFSGRFMLDWPLANNQAQGNLTKARASWRKGVIVADDLKRTIKSDVVNALESLKETVFQLTKNAEAARFYKTTMDAEKEKYQAGSATLIDTITTEEQLTDSLQNLVTAQSNYASYLADLRFETATLLNYDDEGSGEVNKHDLRSIPYIKGGHKN